MLHSTPPPCRLSPHSRSTFHLVTLRCHGHYPHSLAFPSLCHLPATIECSLPCYRLRSASHYRGMQPTMYCLDYRFRSISLPFGEYYWKRSCFYSTVGFPRTLEGILGEWEEECVVVCSRYAQLLLCLLIDQFTHLVSRGACPRPNAHPPYFRGDLRVVGGRGSRSNLGGHGRNDLDNSH